MEKAHMLEQIVSFDTNSTNARQCERKKTFSFQNPSTPQGYDSPDK